MTTLRLLAACAALLTSASLSAAAPATGRHYLSGLDKDSDVEWEFMCTSGRNSGSWSSIKVPSCWETQGFGTYYYGWEEPYGSDETGHYRHRFDVPAEWRGSRVDIVFEGSMTDTEVRINGRKAGPAHEGGFYRFSYDISDKLRYGRENTLEVTVRKCPADSSIYRAERQTDFWLFGGIYRPVYLEVKPRTHIAGLAIDARADGTLRVKPELSGRTRGTRVAVHVESLDGRRLSKPVEALPGDTIVTAVAGIEPWTHERPRLYRVVAELRRDGRPLHRVEEKTGFRTVEFRPSDGFYLNGRRIIFKGVNRHCFHPESGRTLSRAVSLADTELIKDMNMNAVRMAHYPPDKDFLEICDSLGLLVIDELCSWQKKYDTDVARRLVRPVVERDRNHPCVVIWANGNEGGWNTDVDDDYRLYDLQHRFVMHPWERFRGTDTKHYPDYNYVVNSSLYDRDVYFPTEFMHGVFDGGAAASLADFWDVMMKHRAPAGGFIWALLDEGLVRSDMNDSIDCRGDLAPDGIVGPYREKEASYHAVRDIWSPVRLCDRAVTVQCGDELTVENGFMFTDLADCSFGYALVDVRPAAGGGFVETVAAEGAVEAPSCEPGERRRLRLGLPEGWSEHDILRLRVADPTGREVAVFSRPIGTDDRLQRRLLAASASGTGPAETAETDSLLTVAQGGRSYVFDKTTGLLSGIATPSGRIPLQGGPDVATAADNSCTSLRCYRRGDDVVVEPVRRDGGSVRWTFAPGMPPRVDYSFSVAGDTDYIGIGFSYPEDKVLAMSWVGEGPYRVWKNRMQGTSFGCHAKTYNNTVTGESWDYPEFKGYHADCRAVTVATAEGPLTFVPSRTGLFFRMLTPQAPQRDTNGFTSAPFPAGSFGLMHAIPPVGTKFQQPEKLGPSAQKNIQLNWVPVSGSFWIVVPYPLQ